jgi:hypothetical protein
LGNLAAVLWPLAQVFMESLCLFVIFRSLLNFFLNLAAVDLFYAAISCCIFDTPQLSSGSVVYEIVRLPE